MAALITEAEALDELRLTADDLAFYGSDVEMKMEQATDIVLDHITQADPAWTDADAPPLIKAAILQVLRNLFERTDPLPDFVKHLLRSYRDPTLA